MEIQKLEDLNSQVRVSMENVLKAINIARTEMERINKNIVTIRKAHLKLVK